MNINKKIYLGVCSLIISAVVYGAFDAGKRWHAKISREPPHYEYELLKNLEVNTDLEFYILRERTEEYQSRLISKEKEVINDIISGDKEELSRDRDELHQMELALEEMVQLLKIKK